MNFTQKNRKVKQHANFREILNLQNKMMFLLGNISNFFHVDVLESQWTKLQARLKEVQEFDVLKKLLNDYLDEIAVQSFLTKPLVVQGVFNIINTCKRFYYHLEMNENEGLEGNIEELRKIKAIFEKETLEWLKNLIKLQEAAYSNFLNQLLFRLDFNSYFLSASSSALVVF